MNVTVEVVGADTHDLSLGDDATYADVIQEVGFSPQEASVLVDGSPVPEDRVVDASRVELLRLIKGGSDGNPDSRLDSVGHDLSFPNAGPGPRSMSLTDVDANLVVLLFHRDFLCGNCRKQVEAVCERYDEFVALDAEVVSVLPEPRDKAEAWVDYHDMPYPILADPDTELADRHGQQVKFGPLGRKFDLLGRMPLALVVDLRREPEVLWRRVGSTPVDRPDVDELLAELRKFA